MRTRVTSGFRCIGLLAACLIPLGATADDAAPAVNRPLRANFEREHASREARYVADWVVDSGDNVKLPFVIVDKKDAKVFVFDAHGRLNAAAPALLGHGAG